MVAGPGFNSGAARCPEDTDTSTSSSMYSLLKSSEDFGCTGTLCFFIATLGGGFIELDKIINMAHLSITSEHNCISVLDEMTVFYTSKLGAKYVLLVQRQNSGSENG